MHLLLLLLLPTHTEAEFVASALVRESVGSGAGDDDKIYFFFTERNPEQTTTLSHGRVARVARVCKVSEEEEEKKKDKGYCFATGSEALRQLQ